MNGRTCLISLNRCHQCYTLASIYKGVYIYANILKSAYTNTRVAFNLLLKLFLFYKYQICPYHHK